MRQATDFFALLSLPAAFGIDPAALERAYFSLQREYHPDRTARLPADERVRAAEMSMRINEAYRTLKAPLSRAKYLLLLQGIRVGTESDTIKPSPNLLTEAMEHHEALEEAHDATALTALQEQTDRLINQCLDSLAESFKREAFADAAQIALRLGYLLKFSREIALQRMNPAP